MASLSVSNPLESILIQFKEGHFLTEKASKTFKDYSDLTLKFENHSKRVAIGIIAVTCFLALKTSLILVGAIFTFTAIPLTLFYLLTKKGAEIKLENELKDTASTVSQINALLINVLKIRKQGISHTWHGSFLIASNENVDPEKLWKEHVVEHDKTETYTLDEKKIKLHFFADLAKDISSKCNTFIKNFHFPITNSFYLRLLELQKICDTFEKFNLSLTLYLETKASFDLPVPGRRYLQKIDESAFYSIALQLHPTILNNGGVPCPI